MTFRPWTRTRDAGAARGPGQRLQGELHVLSHEAHVHELQHEGQGGGRGAGFCLLGLGGRTCCTARGVEASLETLSSHRGEDGEDDSTARY